MVVQPKPWYRSKTLWFNVVAGITLIAGYFGFNDFIANPEMLDTLAKIMAAVLPLANIGLRLITKAPVSAS